MKRLVAIGFAGCALMSLAMPTRNDLAKAQEMVSDVTAADVAALKAGTKKPAEVAATHLALADKANSEAEKYLLLQGAFHLYAKAGDYDHAAEAVERMQTEIADFNPEVIVELCGKELIRKMKENAPRLYALKENARRIVFYRKQLPVRAKAAKDKPTDVLAQRKLGECHAELGDWPKALAAFAKAGGELAKTASAESSGTAKAQVLADFWWDYETKSDTPVYRLHAAEWYRQALADNTFQGLARERADRRVKEVGAEGAVVTSPCTVADKAGPLKQSVPNVKNTGGETVKNKGAETVNALAAKPLSFELAKGLNLELAHCPAGTFKMSNAPGGPNGDGMHEVKLTRAYWIASARVTREMYKAFEADYDKDEQAKDGKKPYDLVGGRARAEAFAGWLNKRFGSKLPQGYVFRLPTEAEWEYAYQRGVVAKRYEFEGTLDTAKAISKKQFAWKFDLSVMDYPPQETDPVRICTQEPAWVCRQSDTKRFLLRPDAKEGVFRMAIGPDLLAEKRK